MSNILRSVDSSRSNRVFIGEKHRDFEKEAVAVNRLGHLIPLVNIVTDSDGAKLIPIQEVFKIEQYLTEACEESRKAGFEQGFEEGKQVGLKEARNVLAQFNEAIANAVTQREGLLNEARDQVLKMVMQISRKVTFDSIEVDPESVIKLIEGVIDGLIDRSVLRIKVNPRHLPIVEQNMDRFLEGSTTIKEIKIEPDPRVKYGGCFIETPTGDIDARLESQFEVVEEALNSDGE
ncbi:MAG: FliH/SctL family protein [bacterium]|nr:FliH/SctL family protein [bacterium]